MNIREIERARRLLPTFRAANLVREPTPWLDVLATNPPPHSGCATTGRRVPFIPFKWMPSGVRSRKGHPRRWTTTGSHHKPGKKPRANWTKSTVATHSRFDFGPSMSNLRVAVAAAPGGRLRCAATGDCPREHRRLV